MLIKYLICLWVRLRKFIEIEVFNRGKNGQDMIKSENLYLINYPRLNMDE